MNDWILQGAIIGVVIGALMGLTGDPLIELIDSLIRGSRTSASEETISSSDEEDRLKQDFEKEIQEEIEPIIPLKKWQQENQEHETFIKQSRKCDDLFQEWNNLCSWFGTKSQVIADTEIEMDALKRGDFRLIDSVLKWIDKQRAEIDRNCREGDRIFKMFEYSGLAIATFETAGAYATMEMEPGLIRGGAEVVHAYKGSHDQDRKPEWRVQDEAYLDDLERKFKHIKQQFIDNVTNRLKQLKDEYPKNRRRLLEIEQLMRTAGCDKIYEKMGLGKCPSKCPNVDTAPWEWINSRDLGAIF